MTYQKAANQDGEQVIIECIKAGTMTTRFNKKLPPSTKIPWPQNQEVAYTTETWSDAKINIT